MEQLSQEIEIRLFTCQECGATIDRNAVEQPFCRACARTYPPALIKASNDPFDYACRLRTGEIICFRSATIQGNFVTLEINQDNQGGPLPFSFDRGIEVQVSDIVWCADAPNGS